MKLSVRPPRFTERRPAPVILSSRGSSAPLLSAFLRPRLRPASGCLSGPAASAAPAIPPAMLRCGTRHRKHLPPSVLLRFPTPAMLSAVAPVRNPASKASPTVRFAAISDSGNAVGGCSGAEPGIESISHRPFCCDFRLRQCCRRLLRCGTRHRKHLPPSVLLRIPAPAIAPPGRRAAKTAAAPAARKGVSSRLLRSEALSPQDRAASSAATLAAPSRGANAFRI